VATRSIRLDRMQAGLRAWVTAILPSATVAWGRTQLPRDAAAPRLVSLRSIAGPRSAGAGGPSVRSWTLLTSGTFTVPVVEPGDVLTVTASGARASYTVLLDDTTEDARDGLLLALQASSISGTFLAAGTTQIAATCAPGDWYELTTSGLTFAGSGGAYQVQLDEVTYRVELQIADTRPAPMDGAAAGMAELLASIRLPTARAVFQAFGLTVRPGTPINLDRLSGPGWESREVVDLEVTLLSLKAEQAHRMVQVLADIEIQNESATLDMLSVAAAES
jgi:hypothetical protein